MDVTSGKQAREKALLGAWRGLLVKGDHNAFIPPAGEGGRQGQPMLWRVNFLFPPNQPAEVGMFYFRRHVSAWV